MAASFRHEFNLTLVILFEPMHAKVRSLPAWRSRSTGPGFVRMREGKSAEGMSDRKLVRKSEKKHQVASPKSGSSA